MASRKQKEIDWANYVRSGAKKDHHMDKRKYKYHTANKKYYAIDRGNREYVYDWIEKRCRNKHVLDYCCGDGRYTFFCAEHGAKAIGIDISNVTISNCQAEARKKGLRTPPLFLIMDAEKTSFEDNSFDLIMCMGVLHHLDLNAALVELRRILKPDGKIICTEALGNNPFIQLYRKMTPHLRTEYEAEHIIKIRDLQTVEKFFEKVEVKFFHLLTIAAVPFRSKTFFLKLLGILERADEFLLKLPLVRFQAWMIVFELSIPIK